MKADTKGELSGAFEMSDEGWDMLEEIMRVTEAKSTLSIDLPGLPFAPKFVILNGVEYVRKEEGVDESSTSGSE